MKLFIYGASDFGIQTYKLIKYHYHSEYDFQGFIDDSLTKDIEVIDGFKVLGGGEFLENYSKYESHEKLKTALFIAVGYNNLSIRYNIYLKCKELGFIFPNFIHPASHVEKDLIKGEGNFILSGAVIDQSVVIGDINFIDIGCIIGHNSFISNNNYISAGTVIAGFVTIGDSNFFGIQSAITDKLKIGSNNFINAGSLVARNINNDNIFITIIEQKEYKKP